jgi:hypothetical protein
MRRELLISSSTSRLGPLLASRPHLWSRQRAFLPSCYTPSNPENMEGKMEAEIDNLTDLSEAESTTSARAEADYDEVVALLQIMKAVRASIIAGRAGVSVPNSNT